MLLTVGLHIVFIGQTVEGAKSLFNEALIHSDGAKLYSALSPAELNGTTAKACGQFLALVTKPRLHLFSSIERSPTKILAVSDPKSTLTIRFLPTGGTVLVVQNSRKYAFEPTVVRVGKDVKASTGFASLAFWVANQENVTNAAPGDRKQCAIRSHNLVKSWVPKFLKMGIKGSIDPEIGKYLTWSHILDSSQKEIDTMKSGRK